MRPKSSSVWKHFVEINNEKAKCKICDKTYSKKGRTTSALLLHLKTVHKDEFSKLQSEKSHALKNKKKTTPNKSEHNVSQLTLQKTIEKKTPWPSTHHTAIEIDKLVAEMISLHDLPFLFVEAIGFKKIIAKAWPSYHMRGRDYFTKFTCEELYARMAEKVKKNLEEFDYISFTTDIWSDPSSSVSLLSLTAHALTCDMEYKTIILKCEPVTGSHTGNLIVEKINLMLDEWNLQDRVHCFVHDRGSNIVCAMNSTKFDHVNCAVHQLQLCIKSVVLSNKKVSTTIDKAKKAVGHFNHSVLAQDRLKEIQEETLGKSYLHVIQDCPTRWNSTFYMMERLVEIREAIALYNVKYGKATIDVEDWEIMKSCIEILKPFEEITREFSKKNSCISTVIPMLQVLKKSLGEAKNNMQSNTVFNTLIDDLKSDIENKFSDIHI